MRSILSSRKALTASLLLACLAGLAYWQRTPVLAWYHVWQLARAYPENREVCAKRVAALEEAALPRLLAHLSDTDPITCTNMTAALACLAKNWGPGDGRTQKLVERLNEGFDRFSHAGQEKTVLFLIGLLQQDERRPLPVVYSQMVSNILVRAEKEDTLRGFALLLAGELVDCVQPGQWVDACRDMTERGLDDAAPATRIAALRLLARGPMRQEKVLVARALPRLTDREADVRRAALDALAAENEIVREETLLPLLHDQDVQVQYHCELALRRRGLSDDDMRLARMISDKAPATRIRVLHHLHKIPDQNLGSWLLRLSQDPAPAVRASALRAIADYPHVDLADRLREMADQDPSETVRLNARYFLLQHAARSALK